MSGEQKSAVETKSSRRKFSWIRVWIQVFGVLGVLVAILAYRFVREYRDLLFAESHGLRLEHVPAERLAGFHAVPFLADELKQVILHDVTFSCPEPRPAALPPEVFSRLEGYTLRRLEFVGYRVTPELLEQLASQSLNWSITFRQCEMPGTEFGAACENLPVSEVVFSEMEIPLTAFEAVSHLPSLYSARIDRCEFEGQSLAALAGSESLKVVELIHLPISTSVTTPLAEVRTLEGLVVSDTEAHGSAFDPLVGHSLKRVTLRRTVLDAPSMKSLGRLKNVDEFYFQDSEFDKALLGEFEGSNATGLTLEGCDVRDEHLQFVALFRNVVDLALNENPLDGSGLPYLLDLPLESLALAATNVSDQTISTVLEIGTLRTIQLECTDVSEEKVVEMESENPDLEIWPKSAQRYFEYRKEKGLGGGETCRVQR